MPLLIDGYNLMHAAGVASAAAGRTSLERSRAGLLAFLADYAAAVKERDATVVFDAAGAPPGLPARLSYRGLDVQFSRGYRDADELLETLIAAHHAPRQLTVVSSDHRVQRAAKRRRAAAIDSDLWYEQARRDERQARQAENVGLSPAEQSPTCPDDLSTQVAEWLESFTADKASSDTTTASPFSEEYLNQIASEWQRAQQPQPPRPKRRGGQQRSDENRHS